MLAGPCTALRRLRLYARLTKFLQLLTSVWELAILSKAQPIRMWYFSQITFDR